MRPGRRLPSLCAGLVFVAVLSGCAAAEALLPEPVTGDAERLRSWWGVTNVAGLGVAALVYGLIAWALVRYRRRSDDLPSQHPHNIPIEVVYTVAPLAIVGVLFAVSFGLQRDVIDGGGSPDLTVEVVGFQWQWQFRYPDAGVVVTGAAGELPALTVPVDRTTRLRLISSDVNHSFWAPRLLTKRDLIRGVDNELHVRPDEPGEWVGRCAEFCGLDHWRMLFQVRALPAAEFDRWLAEQAQAARP